MVEPFLAMLDPMLTLFFMIAIGFALRKLNILPDSAGKAMAKLETWIFCPALSFLSMVRCCTVETIATHATNLFLSIFVIVIAIPIGIILAKLFVRSKNAERGIFCYALVFANSGYMGDPLILSLMGEEALAYYKFFCIPVTVGILTWGVSMLIPKGGKRGDLLKSIFNPAMVALFLGIFAGLLGFGKIMPQFMESTLQNLMNCMGPVAMLLAGFTIAGYKTREIIGDKKVYIASLLRMTLIPAALIAAVFGAKELVNLIFGLSIDNTVLYLTFFAYATPLGMNTIVYPESYGGNPRTGASMALVSHTLAIIAIPLTYSLLTVIFGAA